MTGSVRNYIIVVFLLCCWVPFILMTDLFPFMRMGMFAEPIKEDFQTERFELWIYQHGKKHLYDPLYDGNDASVFHYLARNYYYRNEVPQFITYLNLQKHFPDLDSITFVRYTRPLKQSSREDTIRQTIKSSTVVR